MDIEEAGLGPKIAWSPAKPPSREAIVGRYVRLEPVDPARLYAVIDSATGRAAGMASYLRMAPADGVIETGHIWFTPLLQRTRQATEAIFLMAKYAFDTLGNRRFEWKCNARNAPSRRAAQRFGFTFEGIFRQHMVVKGRNRDTAWYAMIDRDWPGIKAAFEAWLDPANFDAGGREKKKLNAEALAGPQPF